MSFLRNSKRRIRISTPPPIRTFTRQPRVYLSLIFGRNGRKIQPRITRGATEHIQQVPSPITMGERIGGRRARVEGLACLHSDLKRENVWSQHVWWCASFQTQDSNAIRPRTHGTDACQKSNWNEKRKTEAKNLTCSIVVTLSNRSWVMTVT